MTADTPSPSTDPRPGSDELVRHALHERLAALLGERTGVQARDPDAVHRMRVASRRVREALRLSGPVLGEESVRALMREGRQVTRALGQLREEQVCRGLLAELQAGSSGDVAIGFDYLIVRFEKRIAKHHRRASARLRRLDLRRLEKRLHATLAASPPRLPSSAPVELIGPAARAANEELVAAREQPDDERLHELRIGVKRLRYAVEVLAGHSERGARYARSLKRLQDALGRYHDLAVLVSHVARERSKLAQARRTALAHAVGAARRRVLEAKREALAPLVRVLERWPPGSLLDRSLRVVRAAARVARPQPAAAPASLAGAPAVMVPAAMVPIDPGESGPTS